MTVTHANGSKPKKPQDHLRWYVVRTESRREKRAALEIEAMGVTVFLPLHYEFVKDGKWYKPEARGPLFPRYIFIMARQRSPWGKIRDARGVERVICKTDGTPVPVPYRQMRFIRTRHKRGEKKRIEPKFKQGQRVRVTNGPFESFEGTFDGSAQNRVKVLLSIFGRETEVQIPETDLRGVA